MLTILKTTILTTTTLTILTILTTITTMLYYNTMILLINTLNRIRICNNVFVPEYQWM